MYLGILVLGVVLSHATAVSSPRQPDSQDLPDGYIEISGAKTPSSIPEWVAWRSALGVLARSADDPDSVVFTILETDEPEKSLIGGFAKEQEARWAACRDQQIAILQRFEDADPKRAQSLIDEDQIVCRTNLLDAKDAFLSTLTSRASMALQSFVDDHRTAISVQVPASRLGHFRRPR